MKENYKNDTTGFSWNKNLERIPQGRSSVLGEASQPGRQLCLFCGESHTLSASQSHALVWSPSWDSQSHCIGWSPLSASWSHAIGWSSPSQSHTVDWLPLSSSWSRAIGYSWTPWSCFGDSLFFLHPSQCFHTPQGRTCSHFGFLSGESFLLSLKVNNRFWLKGVTMIG